MPNESDLVRVTFEYKDGKKVVLEGEDLDIWLSTTETAMSLAYIHGMVPDRYKELWERIEVRVKRTGKYP